MQATAMIALLAILSIGLTACGGDAVDPGSSESASPASKTTAPSDAGPVLAKRSVPIQVEAVSVTQDGAQLRVVIPAGAEAVSIRLHGVDGLDVTSDAFPVSDQNFPEGETMIVDVTFQSPQTPSYLNASLRGTFHGTPMGGVQTFLVPGDGTPAPRSRTISIDPATGEGINLGGPIAPDAK